MTIKEIETLSGMERANICFYECEDLISPIRMENGYRHYSEDDLDILLRTKLLRSLHISLEEIKALKNGTKELSATLKQQITALEYEKQGVEYAQDVCRGICGDCVSFYNLDAKKYLDGIHRIVQETGNTYFTIKDDVLPHVFYPWRRWLARILDIFIYSCLWFMLLGLVFHVNLATRSNLEDLFDTFITLLIMLLLEPFFLHLFGTTPGKTIFGLKIEKTDGIRLSYAEGLERVWGVLGKGMGYNIPIYNLIRLWKSYALCSENETQPWDANISYTIKDTKWYRSVIFVGAGALLFGVLTLTIIFAQLPPNRGELTVSEFSENYNYLASYLDIGTGGKYLDSNGKWTKKHDENIYHVDEIGRVVTPEFSYTIENGYVTGISFELELKNNQEWLLSHNSQMILAVLSYAGTQDEIGTFSNARQEMVKRIVDNSCEDFNIIEGGVEVMCNVEHFGYLTGSFDMLVPEETDKETYYKIEFSMKKTK